MKRKYFSLAPVVPNKYVSFREAYCLVALLETEGTRQAIAKVMGISHRTVDVHLGELRTKLDCKNKRELIEKGQLCHWIEWSKEIKALNPQPSLTGKRSKKYQETVSQKATLQKGKVLHKPTNPKLCLADYLLRLRSKTPGKPMILPVS